MEQHSFLYSSFLKITPPYNFLKSNPQIDNFHNPFLILTKRSLLVFLIQHPNKLSPSKGVVDGERKKEFRLLIAGYEITKRRMI